MPCSIMQQLVIINDGDQGLQNLHNSSPQSPLCNKRQLHAYSRMSTQHIIRSLSNTSFLMIFILALHADWMDDYYPYPMIFLWYFKESA